MKINVRFIHYLLYRPSFNIKDLLLLYYYVKSVIFLTSKK